MVDSLPQSSAHIFLYKGYPSFSETALNIRARTNRLQHFPYSMLGEFVLRVQKR